jgi:hypothetical protein
MSLTAISCEFSENLGTDLRHILDPNPLKHDGRKVENIAKY